MPSALSSHTVHRKPSTVEIGSFSTLPTKEELKQQHARSQSVSRNGSASSSTADLSSPTSNLQIPGLTDVPAKSNGSSGASVFTSDTASVMTAQQDLSEEVQALSTKLVKAINHQSSLEEGLEETRHELDVSKERIKQLEAIAKEHQDMMATGVLVEKREVEMETRQLMNKLMEEAAQRGKAEKEKKHIEQDLENLTTSLFEEANKMVIAARKEREAVIRRNDQLEQQLSDTELLLSTHQEQLSELKDALQQITAERDELEALSLPATPALQNQASRDSLNRIFEALHIPGPEEELSPSHPTHFSTILQPVLRSDISAFHDFCNVLHMSKHFAPPPPPNRSQPATPPMSGFSIMGFGSSPKISPLPSSASFFGGGSNRKSVSSIHSNASAASAPVYATSNPLPQAPALRDTVFFKRVLVEDIEPTLRLDNAPGISWMARRTVLTAVIEGTLVIEIMPPISKLPIFSCSMCGEARNDPTHARTHRFRTNETEAAQKYPLCGYCVNRLRSVCAFMAFLRTAKEGYIKCESEDEEKSAWEESVKLREQMFWSRVGGGVVPSFNGIREDIIKAASPTKPPTRREEKEEAIPPPISKTAALRNKFQSVTVQSPPERRNLPPALPPRGKLVRATPTTMTERAIQTNEEDIEASGKYSDAVSQTEDSPSPAPAPVTATLSSPINEKAEAESITAASLRSRDSHLPSPPQSPMMSVNKAIPADKLEEKNIDEEKPVEVAKAEVEIPGAFK